MGNYKDSEQNKNRKLQKGKQHVPWPNPSKIGFEHSALGASSRTFYKTR